MKYLISFFIASAFLLFACQERASEADSVPAEVQSSFENEYPQAQKVVWEKEGEDEYEVEFLHNDEEYELSYNAMGEVTSRSSRVDETQLPQTVLTYLESNYPDWKIDEAEINDAGEADMQYEIEIRKESGDESMEKELLFDANGNFLSVEDDVDDKKEDENTNM